MIGIHKAVRGKVGIDGKTKESLFPASSDRQLVPRIRLKVARLINDADRAGEKLRIEQPPVRGKSRCLQSEGAVTEPGRLAPVRADHEDVLGQVLLAALVPRRGEREALTIDCNRGRCVDAKARRRGRECPIDRPQGTQNDLKSIIQVSVPADRVGVEQA